MSSSFSTDGASVIKRNLDTVSEPMPGLDSVGSFSTVYEYDKCMKWILDNSYTRIALQFPDELFTHAVEICLDLRHLTNSDVFILGDTAYGNCCVDSVAAEHYNADCIIHFGQACLSLPCKIPVLYVFGHAPIDIPDCVSQLKKLIQPTDKILLLYDVMYDYARTSIIENFEDIAENVYVPNLDIPKFDKSSENTLQNNVISKFGRIISTDIELQDYKLIYIGKENIFLTNWMFFIKAGTFLSYDPAVKECQTQEINVNKLMMKRYYLVEKAKDAKIIGLIVGTLGVADYSCMLDRLRRITRLAGKHSYTFIVGKVNVPKLANFMEVDVYVLVSCPQNILFDSSEFYKPVITPFELEVACNPNQEWTGDIVTDFTSLLPGGDHYVEEPTEATKETGDVSMITGGVRCIGVEEPLLIKDDAGQLLKSENVVCSLAGERLGERTWMGLEPRLGQTPVVKATEGLKGVAMGYSSEPKST